MSIEVFKNLVEVRNIQPYSNGFIFVIREPHDIPVKDGFQLVKDVPGLFRGDLFIALVLCPGLIVDIGEIFSKLIKLVFPYMPYRIVFVRRQIGMTGIEFFGKPKY